MEFTSCNGFTVGAEWELQLLDGETLDLAPRIDSLLRLFEGSPYVTPEFFQSCVELNTPVCAMSADIGKHLARLTREVTDGCRSNGLELAGAGTHPFCRRLALVTHLPRYEELASVHGYIGQTQLAFATHIHVGITSGDDAIRIMRHLTPALPLLIAIGANSPFWRGHVTGYASYRRRLLTAARTYGMPPYFDDWQDFRDFFKMAVKSQSIKSIKDVHWDIRPHPDFGTLEIRVTDSQSTLDDLVFVAGLTRCLVAFIDQAPTRLIENTLPRHLSPWTDRENHFRASHWGMEASLIDDRSGNVRPITYYLGKFAAEIGGLARDIGEASVLDRLLHIAEDTPGYELQLQAYAKHNDARDVVRCLRDRLECGLVSDATSTQ